ncbi:hypothetical protein JW851_02070, partial [Candidatus Woesearchaeota archaeon]|nr:hypothetical protein [Candidatus Woesearchaeota archaeon]
GGVIPPKSDIIDCWEYWTCSDWTECINGTQTRNCSDLNKCSTFESKPSETKQCIMPAKEEPKTSRPITKIANVIKEIPQKEITISNTRIKIIPIIIGVIFILLLISIIAKYNKKYVFNKNKSIKKNSRKKKK